MVRQLQRGDSLLSEYRELRIQLWPDCRDDCDREIQGILSDPLQWAVFIASPDGKKAVGFLEVRLRDYVNGARSSPVGFLEGWYVTAKYRKQGVGEELVKAGEKWAASRGCREMGSDTQIENEASIEVHKKLGYQEAERVVCFVKPLQ